MPCGESRRAAEPSGAGVAGRINPPTGARAIKATTNVSRVGTHAGRAAYFARAPFLAGRAITTDWVWTSRGMVGFSLAACASSPCPSRLAAAGLKNIGRAPFRGLGQPLILRLVGLCSVFGDAWRLVGLCSMFGDACTEKIENGPSPTL